VTAPSSVRVLTIGVGPTFAMKWLIPRLADFVSTNRHRRADYHGGAAPRSATTGAAAIKLGDGEWRVWWLNH